MKRAHAGPVLALVPSAAGIGFAVIERRTELADWGLARIWAESDNEFIARVECLVERHQPGIIVVEGYSSRYSGKRIKRSGRIIEFATSTGIRVIQVSRQAVRAWCGNPEITKHEIALLVAETFPELRPHLPPPRKPWTSESKKMPMFDAVALAAAALALGQDLERFYVPS